MKTLLKAFLIASLVGVLGFATMVLIGQWQFSRMTDIEKCVVETQIKVLKQSPFSPEFYKEQRLLVRVCTDALEQKPKSDFP